MPMFPARASNTKAITTQPGEVVASDRDPAQVCRASRSKPRQVPRNINTKRPSSPAESPTSPAVEPRTMQ